MADMTSPSKNSTWVALAPMGCLSCGILAMVMLLDAVLVQGAVMGVGAFLFLLLALGSFLGLRWTMSLTIILSGLLMIVALMYWLQTGIPRVPYVLLTPVVIFFNIVALKNTHSIDSSKSTS
ncbi:MAG: hypothetical protein HJJLKODD_01459 [Phycisphaerae bacterium]|nr:hypothetical protein [Phycisphaerae bacterium]